MTSSAERGDGRPGAAGWSLVVPVKHLDRAKSRLALAAGVHRSGLALAIACDTVSAARGCPAVGAVFAVTDDARAARALERLGAVAVGGEPGTGLNPALRHGARTAAALRPGTGVCALSADLPALRADELDRVLRAAALRGRSFLADAQGVGTTLFAAAPGHPFTPAFEGASRARHLAQGTAELGLADVETVRRDVDTPEDLHAAAALGMGPRTRALLPLLAART